MGRSSATDIAYNSCKPNFSVPALKQILVFVPSRSRPSTLHGDTLGQACPPFAACNNSTRTRASRAATCGSANTSCERKKSHKARTRGGGHTEHTRARALTCLTGPLEQRASRRGWWRLASVYEHRKGLGGRGGGTKNLSLRTSPFFARACSPSCTGHAATSTLRCPKGSRRPPLSQVLSSSGMGCSDAGDAIWTVSLVLHSVATTGTVYVCLVEWMAQEPCAWVSRTFLFSYFFLLRLFAKFLGLIERTGLEPCISLTRVKPVPLARS